MGLLRERLTALVVGERMLADRTESTRRNLSERMDVPEAFLGQAIDRLQDHAANPDAHEDDEP